VIAQYSQTTELDDMKNSNSFRIYPNPTNGIIVIEQEKAEQLNEKISIIDNQGRTVYYKGNMSAEKSIDISNLPEGVYFISIGNVIQKVIKE